MRFYIGITDEDWYRSLKDRRAAETNFWRPGATAFRALEPGGLFLFKLRHPKNVNVGGGHFVHYSRIFSSFAWEAFREDNGVDSYLELLERLGSLRHRDSAAVDPEIGCIILDNLFFLDEPDWIPAPSDWAKNIVSGRGYDLISQEGRRVWAEVRLRIEGVTANQPMLIRDDPVRFRESVGMRRLGQGAFRAIVAAAYQQRCAITGERTLPVLEAAHIRPVTQHGGHYVRNGILMRSDLHRLFDAGYLTISPEHQIRVSSAIRERFQNGRQYYALDGKRLEVLPDDPAFHPSEEELDWHGRTVYLR